MDTTWAYFIGEADEVRVLEGIKAAPQYGKSVAGAIKHTIKVIHGLQKLHPTYTLQDLEVYLGRSSEDPAQVLGRWERHRNKYGHKYAAVLFTCEVERAVKLEGLANNLLEKLRARGALCVGNANTAPDGRGKIPGTPLAVIYMTWGKNQAVIGYGRPTIDDIRQVAEEAYRQADVFVTKQQLERGLMAMKRKTNWDRLRWSRP
jgi:hypothetical protein